MKRSSVISTKIMILFFSAMILNGCGVDETPPELPDIEYKLVITDSIGVEIGEDEYMFAWPENPTHSPDGDILVIDRLKHTVFVYTSDGEFVRTIGREGEGPGEFRLPSGLAFYSDGSLLIGDADGISLFDSSYEYQEQLTWSGFGKPWLKTAVDSGGFIGTEMTMMPGENGIEIISTLGRWDGEGEPSVEYFSVESEFNPEDREIDRTESRGNNIISCATRTGRVFYSRSSIDEFVIHGCELDGTEFLLIEDLAAHRVRKNDEDLQAEMDAWNSLIRLMRGDSSTGKPVKLDPYRRIITEMFIDGEDRLWVRLGNYTGIVFRVYDMSGDILFHAMVEYAGNPADLNSWKIIGDEHGFLANNTSYEYYPRIYMLTMVDAE